MKSTIEAMAYIVDSLKNSRSIALAKGNLSSHHLISETFHLPASIDENPKEPNEMCNFK